MPGRCELDLIHVAHVVDAAQVSASLRSRGPVAQSLKLVLLGWSAKVDLQPRLDRDAAIKYISEYASEPETVSDGYHHALDDFCARMCRKTRSDVSSPGWPQQSGTSPHKRPFTCCSATISSTHGTCSEITTMPTMTTLPSRHPSSPATKQPGKPLPLSYQGGVEVCVLHSIGQAWLCLPYALPRYPCRLLFSADFPKPNNTPAPAKRELPVNGLGQGCLSVQT